VTPTGVLLLLICLLIGWWNLYWSRVPEGLPPGPRGFWAFIKQVPSMLEQRHPGEMHHELRKKYGSVYSLYFGNILIVGLGDYAAMRRAFVEQGDVFSGRRADLNPPSLVEKVVNGIIGGQGPLWREQRRFALTTFRDFGVGKAGIEPALLGEIIYFLKAVEDKQGQPFNISDLLAMSICNNICIIEFGRRFEYTDERFLYLKRLVDEFVAVLNIGGTNAILGLLGSLVGLQEHMPHVKRNIQVNREIEAFMREMIAEHYKNYRPGSRADYIDAYFTERAERENQTDGQAELFHDDALESNLEAFFLAGTETTTDTLMWSILFMMVHPDVQRKVQQEIDDVIGRQRTPSVDDKSRMPYTEATLLEVQRKASVVALSVPHCTTEDTELCGYKIPANTVVVANIWGIHHDEAVYPDPHTFRPERFIDEHGGVVKPESFMPFSVGKRFCLGEPLARMEIFLYFTSLLQKFTFLPAEGAILNTKPAPAILSSPDPYLLRAVLRDD
jgi:cytochrome P450